MRLVGWILLAWTGSLPAAVYQAPWSADWHLEADKLSCRLSQTIPHLGRAVFRQEAGRPLVFSLRVEAAADIGDASVQVRPAPWQHRVLPGRRYPATLVTGGREIGVRGPVAERMLAALFAGRFPAFIYRRSWPDGVEEFQVAVSAVRFRDAYDRFQDCRSRLPPYGIADFQDFRVYFRPHRVRLPRDAETRLAQLAVLLRHLGKGQVVVTNVSGDLGGKEGRSWFLKRFRQVKERLRQAGLKPEQVATEPAGIRPRITLSLFGPEGLQVYHYGRRQQALNPRQKRRLRLLARYLTAYFPGDLVIHGYSDGARWRSEKTNRALSRRWAERVRDYLAAQGVDPGRMTIRVWGSRHRVASNLTPAGRAKNRRVRIQLVESPLSPGGDRRAASR